MKKEEIIELKQTVAEDSKEPIDPLEGDAVAIMAESAGWRVMMRKANRKIAELLEPIQRKDVADVKNLELIGAMALARSETIEVLRWFISQVEAEKNARRQMLKDKEESK